MQKTPFIWLGSGRARRRGVAAKGQMLDQAARLGLPVPAGGILLEDFYQICLAEGVVAVGGDVVTVPDPVWLHEVLFRDVRFPRLEQRVALRAAASGAGEKTGRPRARLDVDLDDPEQLAGALANLWSLGHSQSDIQVHDILLMEMVDRKAFGEAVTAAAEEQDTVRAGGGPSAAAYSTFELERITTFQRASADVPPFARRLQKLLRGVRRSFGRGSWQVDWVDDGAICWLLQIEPQAS